MTEAQRERLWFLKGWATGGWRINVRHAKKWEAIIAALVKQGLLEQSGEGRAAMYRITDAGLAALSNTQEQA